jgi:2-succinyl-5-enolpyruvyl-6-hydroxy-3-cyclohexene-1-carboxylate synthase
VMDDSGLTTAWSRAFVDELARLGVGNIALAPGSRSTPLVMACARDDRFKIWTHLDERCAGFFALGVGKDSGTPCAVITTSGTAAANLFPAVVESHQSGVPLLILTADRPLLLRGTDANQTIDQFNLYGSYVRNHFQLGEPQWRDFERIRTIACRAFWETQGISPGPVHVNFAFEKPLEPEEMEIRPTHSIGRDSIGLIGRPEGKPFVTIARASAKVSSSKAEEIQSLIEQVERGLIVAGGSLKTQDGIEAIHKLSEETGFPIIADPLSGIRFGPNGQDLRISKAHLICNHSRLRERLRPDLIIRIGSTPISETVSTFLQECREVPQIVISSGNNWGDHLAASLHYVPSEEGPFLSSLNDLNTRGKVNPEWREEWTKFDRAIENVLLENSKRYFEGNIIRSIEGAIPSDSVLFVSNSMPVRDLDVFGFDRREALNVFGNRGASGIDGIVSTVAGIAGSRMSRLKDENISEDLSKERADAPVVALLGDIAFYHDMNGLLSIAKYQLDIVMVVINNDGGGIFHKLPIREYEPEFTSYFTTPHGLEFEATAELYGIPYRKAVDLSEVAEVFSDLVIGKGPKILEIQVDREENWRCHREIVEAVNSRIDELL